MKSLLYKIRDKDLSKKVIITFLPTPIEKNRISGHTFEAFELSMFLKDNGIDNIIIFQDKINKDKIEKAFFEKYENIDIPDYITRPNFINEEKMYSNIIYTSGIRGDFFNNIKFTYKNFYSFRCNSDIDYDKYLNTPNFYLLQDNRIYKNFKNSIKINKIHYIKKFYFKYYKKISKSRSKILVYINFNLRDLDEEYIKKLINKYKYLNKEFLFVSGSQLNEDQLNKYSKYGEIKIAPVKNIFEQFDTFLYVRNKRNFDCSPRFLTECFYYNKNIIIDFNIEEDVGAFWRWNDIQNNFNKLIYDKNDLLLKILKGNK